MFFVCDVYFCILRNRILHSTAQPKAPAAASTKASTPRLPRLPTTRGLPPTSTPKRNNKTHTSSVTTAEMRGKRFLRKAKPRHNPAIMKSMTVNIFYGYGVLRLWGLRLCVGGGTVMGFTVMRVYGCGVLRLWGFTVMRVYGYGVLRLWGFTVVGELGHIRQIGNMG